MPVRVTSRGSVKFRDKELRQLMKNVTVEAVQRTVSAMASEASERAPVDTGLLASGIESDVIVYKYGTKIVGAVKTNTKEGTKGKFGYGLSVEIGTEHAKPKPYIRPAFDAKKHVLKDNLEHKI